MPRAVSTGEWIEAHHVDYETLFDDGRVQSRDELIVLKKEMVAVTALRRFSVASNKPSPTIKKHREGITAVLDACFREKLGAENAILQDVPPKNLPLLNATLVDIIDRWARSCSSWRCSFPFWEFWQDFEPDMNNRATNLTLLTAASVLYLDDGIRYGRPMPRWAKNGLQYYGLRFTESLVDGYPLPETLFDDYTTHPWLDREAKKAALERHPTPTVLRFALEDSIAAPQSIDLDALQDEFSEPTASA